MQAKTKIFIAMAIIVITISGLMVMGIANFSGQMVTIETVFAQGQDLDGKYLRVEGDLVPGSVDWNTAAVELRFQVTDGERVLDVYHKGIQPDNFYEGVEVILEGHYEGDGLFVAEKVQTRCPSTYEEDIRTKGEEVSS